jgi:hypothetical protein
LFRAVTIALGLDVGRRLANHERVRAGLEHELGALTVVGETDAFGL